MSPLCHCVSSLPLGLLSATVSPLCHCVSSLPLGPLFVCVQSLSLCLLSASASVSLLCLGISSLSLCLPSNYFSAQLIPNFGIVIKHFFCHFAFLKSCLIFPRSIASDSHLIVSTCFNSFMLLVIDDVKSELHLSKIWYTSYVIFILQ